MPKTPIVKSKDESPLKKVKRTAWYCPCDCKTPMGMNKKFFALNSLCEHLIQKHSTQLDIKLMYKLKSSDVIEVGKKRTAEEYEDGFKEILSG
jgi:hypothetical protein